MDNQQLTKVVEAALLAAGRPLSLDELRDLAAAHGSGPTKPELRAALTQLQEDCEDRAIEIREVASGFRAQVRAELAPWLTKLWEQRPPRYSRALMETLAIIAYRQPVTRGEIEDIRGVSVTTNIIRTLLEREWIREVGHRDVPGRPAMFGTTREFLDYFGLKKLDDLPELTALTDLESLRIQLELPGEEEVPAAGESEGVQPDAAGEQAGSEDAGTVREFGPEPVADEFEDDLPIAANVVQLKTH
ncbi:MAG: SMC-Scp complex subunit ScpB [Chromatiales bacterium]|nr:MAG: SMC-Scp complex subunit ScpB [Chromatiales bacterium]